MPISDNLTNVLLVLLFLATPLVFAASLYFQQRNHLTSTVLPSSKTEEIHPKSAEKNESIDQASTSSKKG